MPRLYSEYTVELVDNSHRVPDLRVDVRSDGVFEANGVQPGDYTVIVTTSLGGFICQQFVRLGPEDNHLTIRMPDAPQRNYRGPATVSATQLLHPPSKKATRAFYEALQFSSAGDYQHATEKLQAAVRDSPDFAEAHLNLGVQYIRAKRPQDAFAEFQRTIDIAGPTAVALFDLGWAQMALGRREDAEKSLRAGLHMEPSSAQGNLLLGALLARNPETRNEAITHLRKAADTLPSARAMLDQLTK